MEKFCMKLREIMTEKVAVISPRTTLTEAARKMKEMNIGALPICDNDRLVGLVTDRDIVVRALANGSDPETTLAKDVMSSPVIYCMEDDEIEVAADLMEEKQIRRMLIINKEKRLVGFVSLGDLAVDSKDEILAGEVIERI